MRVVDVLASQDTLTLVNFCVGLHDLDAPTTARCDRFEDPEGRRVPFSLRLEQVVVF